MKIESIEMKTRKHKLIVAFVLLTCVPTLCIIYVKSQQTEIKVIGQTIAINTDDAVLKFTQDAKEIFRVTSDGEWIFYPHKDTMRFHLHGRMKYESLGDTSLSRLVH
jgi:hypothetical protein